MEHSNTFITALKNNDLATIKEIPKADLHNHFVLGGSRKYIERKIGYKIEPIKKVLKSMNEMHGWGNENLGDRFNTREMRKLLIEAAFVQAKEDGVSILEIGEDVWGLGEFFSNDIDELIDAFKTANRCIAPNIELRLQIGLSRHCDVNYLLNCLEPFWGRKEFYSIDLYGDEFAQPIEKFIPIYRKAKDNGLVLKAHIGEWGTAEDVKRGIELLGLDEVQHGIAAVTSKQVINYLIDNHITLNITPTSNVLLGRVENMKVHPIGELYRSGVNVTINSDDILIFDSDVSKEYLSLYNSKVLKAEELDEIRKKGLGRFFKHHL